MGWLNSIDTAFFHLINGSLSHPLLDQVVPFFSGNPFFVPAVILLVVGLLWKGGRRGRLLVLMLAVILALGDGLVINLPKHLIGRPRPFFEIADARVLVGRTASGSMPSSHAATWFAVTLVTFVYYRRSWRFLLPLACLVGYSRIYVGVHYPGDVLAGAILGAGYAAAGLVSLDLTWQTLGRRWFPVWWERLPTLLAPDASCATGASPGAETRGGQGAERATLDQHWLRLGYVFIGTLLLFRFVYIASGTIELSEDEAYQWTWSKHLALSYFSKPPLIACIQWLGTHLWGDTEFGVRFFSPVMAALLNLLVLRFVAREFNSRAAFFVVLIGNLTLLLAVGSVLMTVDPPLVLFWTAAMVTGWRAVQPAAATRHWLWVGLWLGLAFLAKYTALYQLVCFAFFFALWPPARRHLRRPGPWLALLVTGLCTLPVIVWNAKHGWITLEHVAGNAGLDQTWRPTLRYWGDFLGGQAALLNPVFLVAALWAMAAFWRRERANPRLLFLFSMGGPVFLGHWLYSLHSRIHPNWVAPAVLPMFCLTVVYWYDRWRCGTRAVVPWLIGGLSSSLLLAVLLHDTNLTGKLIGRTLPASIDPLRRVRGWRETARVVGEVRRQLLQEGKPVFIATEHYGMTGQLSFYLDEARATVRDHPLVYFKSTARPENQFFFWPRYRTERPGQNALFVLEPDWSRPPGSELWQAFVRGNTSLPRPEPQALPQQMLSEFRSVVDLGLFPITYHGRILRWVQIFLCRS